MELRQILGELTAAAAKEESPAAAELISPEELMTHPLAKVIPPRMFVRISSSYCVPTLAVPQQQRR